MHPKSLQSTPKLKKNALNLCVCFSSRTAASVANNTVFYGAPTDTPRSTDYWASEFLDV